MTTRLLPEQIFPSDQETQIARKSGEVLASLIGNKADQVQIKVRTKSNLTADITLPMSAAQLLLGALQEIGKGNAVTIVPINTEITTQQAADILNVSRPFFVKLLEEGKFPYRLVGSHRRILYHDLLKYMENERSRRAKILAELVAESEKLELYK